WACTAIILSVIGVLSHATVKHSRYAGTTTSLTSTVWGFHVTEGTRDAVADRYGAGRTKRFDRRFGWTVASLAVAVGLVVIAFGSWQQSTLEVKNISFT